MPTRVLIATSAALVMAAAVAMAQAPQAPAGRGAAAPAYRAPRTPDGKPNLNGVWQAITEANWDIEAHSAAPSPIKELGTTGAMPAGAGIVEGGTIPYLPEALKKKKENQADRLKLDPEVKCYLPGVPRAVYMPYPFQIVQSTKHIMMLHTYAGAVRTVYMADQTEAPADSWMGWSNGKWDGESLVVDTKGFNDQSWFDRAGNFHSDALHVVERFTPRSADTLNYEATIEDTKTFSRPWKVSLPLYRRVEPNAMIMEFRCVEFVEDLLYGHLRKQPASK